MPTNNRPSGHPLANGSLEHTWLLDDDGCGTLRSNARHRGGSFDDFLAGNLRSLPFKRS